MFCLKYIYIYGDSITSMSDGFFLHFLEIFAILVIRHNYTKLNNILRKLSLNLKVKRLTREAITEFGMAKSP